MKEQNNDRRLFLLDAYALIFRAYYALIRNPMYSSSGLNTSAIYGFTAALEELIRNQKPTHIAVVFDPPTPTFRNELYPAYKANREATPEDIKKAVPYIKKIVNALNIPVIEVPGFEADDVIGTLACKGAEEGYEVFMVTPDKDFGQLVKENIYIYKPAKGGKQAEILGEKEICELYGISNPEMVIDILALWGDASDNVPGVPGIGQKTAPKLISSFSSLEGLYDNVDQLKGKQKENILQSREQAFLAKKLVTIEKAVPVDFTPSELIMGEYNVTELQKLFTELEFKTLANRVLNKAAASKENPVSNQPVQKSLFDKEEPTQPVPLTDAFDTIHSVNHNYILVDDTDKLLKILPEWKEQKEFCFDTETSGLNTRQCNLLGIAISWNPHEAYYIALPTGNEKESFISLLQEVFSNDKSLKIGQNLKFDLQVLHAHQIQVNGPLFDTLIAHYLLQPELKHNLNYMSETMLNYRPVTIESLIGEKGKSQRNMQELSPREIVEYAGEDADITLQIKHKLDHQLLESGMKALAYDIEMPLVNVLTAMENNGVRLNVEELALYEKKLSKELQGVEQKIYALAETTFNIGSPKQLGEVLFDKMQITDKAKKTKTKQYSTSEEYLTSLVEDHPIIEQILEYRSLKKLISTYISALPKLIDEKTGKIHTTFNQTIAATGRLSSTNPNLQNIPIREERGREIRKSFVPSTTEHVIISADYSQIELRLMAHLSQDENMIEAFNAGADIHTATAAKIFNVKLDEVTREMRSRAKTANFGIIYGISVFGLSQRLNIPRNEADELIKGYFKSYPGVRQYMTNAIQQAREVGYVETMYGRRRYLPDINSSNGNVRGFAERNAINAPIQGSAADIIKIAMIRIYEEIKKRKLEGRMIIQVHDELLFDVPEKEVSQFEEIIQNHMENAAELKVPLTIDIGKGKNWFEAH